MKSAESKTIVITGGSDGIGRALCTLLASRGHTVVNISRREAEGVSFTYPFDLDSGREAITALAEKIGGKFGKVDMLICNAGYGVSGPLEYISDTEIERIVNVNLLSAVWLTRALVRYMPHGGRIAYVSSVSGIIPMPYRTMYNVTKAALTGLGMSMNVELKPLGIEVCTFLVGAVATDFSKHRERYVTTDERYALAADACDSFIDDRGGGAVVFKL